MQRFDEVSMLLGNGIISKGWWRRPVARAWSAGDRLIKKAKGNGNIDGISGSEIENPPICPFF